MVQYRKGKLLSFLSGIHIQLLGNGDRDLQPHRNSGRGVNCAISDYGYRATDRTAENIGSIPRKWMRFLGGFVKLQSMNIGYVMFVCPSAVSPSV